MGIEVAGLFRPSDPFFHSRSFERNMPPLPAGTESETGLENGPPTASQAAPSRARCSS
jgi:hypothetical protein